MTYNVKLTRGGLTFNFRDEFVKNYDTGPSAEIDKTVMPLGGPMSNLGLDFNGVQKVITMSGEFFDVSESVVTGDGAPNITTALQMKYWIESLVSGNQQAIDFYSEDDEYSLLSSAVPSEPFQVGSATIPGTWVPTKVFVEQPKITRVEGKPNTYAFNINFWVAGF